MCLVRENFMVKVLKHLYLLTFLVSGVSFGKIPLRSFTNGDQRLKLEWPSDHIVHFEYSLLQKSDPTSEIFVSQIFKHYKGIGPKQFKAETNTFYTEELKVHVDGGCFEVSDRLRGHQAGRYCLNDLAQDWKTLEVSAPGVRDVYGLGQIFGEPGKMDAKRIGSLVKTDGHYGNMMNGYAGGAVGQTMFPVAYAMQADGRSWMLLLDNVYKQNWDLRSNPWKVGMFGDRISGYIVAGATPLELRKRLMDIAGRAPIPAKKMFGFWMSEYGYDDWNEVDQKLSAMRRDHFPIDGFFLDLQWFGDVQAGSDQTSMGKLTFNEEKFPSPKSKLSDYLQKNIGIIPIEESYIGKALDEHQDLESRGFMAHDCNNPSRASYLTGQVTGNYSEWWGRGGMIDWTNKAAGQYWHDTKRQKLIELGVFGHWLDLGEPEMFDPNSCYAGSGEPGKNKHADIHNLFSLLWAESVFDGYARNNSNHRPFSILRSGNIGIQRFGAALWSGDIGGNLESLSAHIASQGQMSWSGIDYYSSDIGGFHRNTADGQLLNAKQTHENFTKWFANASWFDVPFRSHVMNLGNDRETSPNKVGHFESNKENLLRRYKLGPYYYSLAWKAWKDGSPLFTPMAMAYPADLRFRDAGGQRMLGDIMISGAAKTKELFTDVSLPVGEWYDHRTGEFSVRTEKSKSVLKDVPLYISGKYELPAYVKAGAVIPVLTKKSLDSLAQGRDFKKADDDLGMQIYINPNGGQSEFVLYEDDGSTTSYISGAGRRTKIAQSTAGLETAIKISGAEGSFSGASVTRRSEFTIFAPHQWQPTSIRLPDQTIEPCHDGQSADEDSCFDVFGGFGTRIVFSTSSAPVSQAQNIVVTWTVNARKLSSVFFTCDEPSLAGRHHSMYVVGSDPVLGAWKIASGVPMTTSSVLGGVWAALVPGLPSGQDLEWKCVKVFPNSDDSNDAWELGANNVVRTSEQGGFSGHSGGSFLKQAADRVSN
jgi:alpha-glucosidase